MTPSPFELDRIPRQGGRRSWPSSLISTTYTQLACSPLSICATNVPLTSASYPVPLHLDLDHLSLSLPSGSPGNNAITMSDKPISRTASGTREVPEARAAMKYSGSHAFEDVHTISSTSSFRTHAPLMNRFRRTAIGDSDHSASELQPCLLFFLIALASGVYYILLWSLVCALESRPCTSSWISQTYSGCTVLQRKCFRLEERSGEPEPKARFRSHTHVEGSFLLFLLLASSEDGVSA